MDRKDDIIIKARKQFTRYGYTKTTMADIARECEITKPTLYHYYTGKADLFAAVVADEQAAFFNTIEQAIGGISSTAKKLRIYVEMQLQSLQEFLLLGDLSRRAFLDLHPDALNVLSVCRVKEEDLLANWLNEGVRTGEFDLLNVRHAAHVFFMTIAALKFDALVLNAPAEDEITAEDASIKMLSENLNQCVDLFLNGLRKRGKNT
ncbi:MAG: TetR/AcrR family transcriptional regulator [Deltaproteobacteria bacterium]|nr:TetR/AcrR family transcriptional regulator [Deltaproteobacteria bacterium]